MRLSSTMRLFAMATAVASLAVAAVSTPASADSTWQRLKKTGTLKVGCLANITYHNINKDTGKWEGMVIEATKQMAKDLEPIGVKNWDCEMTTWGTSALGIQAGKFDAMWNLQATPLRATVITFAGPLFNQGIMMVNRKGFSATTWADYDKPSVKIAVVTVTSTDLVRKLVAPNAYPVALTSQNDLSMAVAANRADALITWAIAGSVMKAKNPGVGDIVIPTPAYTFPQYVGVARDDDREFADFMHWWIEWQRKKGNIEQWLKDRLIQLGMPADVIPKKLLN